MSQSYYTQLSQEERIKIEEMLGLGCYRSEIAKKLKRSKSTISCGIERNGIKSKNHRSRVNKPSCLNEDDRHYRGTLQVDINRKRKEDYRKSA
jgi:IS30 family transposase